MKWNVLIEEMNCLRKKGLVINICEICRQIPCHPRCPNYVPPKASHYCSICGDGIYDGEDYIENQDGEYIHYECVQGIKQLLEWLGYEIKTMEDFDELD